MNLANALLIVSVPFVVTTILVGLFKGGEVYYDSDDYTGNGTAH